MDAAALANAILDAFRERKAMYIQPVSVETAQSFLSGFYLACIACGLVADWDAWNQVAKASGWDTGASCPVPAMRETGMEQEAIIG